MDSSSNSQNETHSSATKRFVYCFDCWHWSWATDVAEGKLRCSKCGSVDCRAQEVDPSWGKNWHEDWVASSIKP